MRRSAERTAFSGLSFFQNYFRAAVITGKDSGFFVKTVIVFIETVDKIKFFRRFALLDFDYVCKLVIGVTTYLLK